MTVYGIERIREFLGNFKSNYIIIGGTATNINLEESALEGRTTHDIDIIVVCEAVTKEYLESFWKMIRTAGYEPGVINTDNGYKRTFYCFDKPKDSSFPKYIELFCRIPESIVLPEDIRIVHISNNYDDLSSFSAIMMDDEYYNFAIKHSTQMQGVQVLDKFALIIFKSKAFVSNLTRKKSGQHVHQDDIDKHKRDVYRLSFLLDEEYEEIDLPETIANDMRLFIRTIADYPINTKNISNYMGVAEINQRDFILKLEKVFNLSKLIR